MTSIEESFQTLGIATATATATAPPNKVKEVLNHRNSRKKSCRYDYQVKFADGSIEWVYDENCDCNVAIGRYCQSQNIKVAHILCRVSTVAQAQPNCLSLDGQSKALSDFLQGKGFDHHREHRMNVSAYKSLSKNIVDIGNSCNPGDMLCVWKIDRLSRNIIKSLSWIDNLSERGVEIYALTENLSYRENKLQFIQGILDAHKESEAISLRVKMSNDVKRERGDMAIGSLPYGKMYSLSGNVKVVVDNNQEQKIIKKIRDSRHNPLELAAQFTHSKILKRGRKWTPGMIKRILSSKK